MMQSKIVELGKYVTYCDERNSDEIYGLDSVRGISIEKKMIFTKANMEGVSLRPYKLFKPNEFCFVPVTSRNGNKITISMNYEDQTYLVSSAYEVFKVNDENELLPEYLYLLFSRSEFDRYARFNSWGSARESFSWGEMQRVQIPLPSIDEQRKVVNAWKALREIKEQNEAISAPLMQVCQSYIQELKHKYPSVEIGEFIEESPERNKELKFDAKDLKGVNCEGKIIDSIANTQGLKFDNYKIVRNGDFAYSNRINVGSIALNRGKDCIISPSYVVFKVVAKDRILPDYLDMWYRRSEFLRSTYFFAFGTIKDDFSINEMKRSRIPLPPLSVQQAIVNIYNCANEAKKIAEEADRKSREICPALIQYVVRHAHQN